MFVTNHVHSGVVIEQWVSRPSGAFGKLDESRPLTSILDRRSAGIKDLSLDPPTILR
jgi:hypothetical protein